MTITRVNFVNSVKKKIEDIYPHISRREIERILEIFLGEFVSGLVDGHRIELRGFGVFFTRMRRPKVARNPKTKEAVRLPTRRVVVFKPSKILKNLLSKGE